MISDQGFFTGGKYKGVSITAVSVVPADYLRWLYWMLDLGAVADRQILSELSRRGEFHEDAKNNQKGRDAAHEKKAQESQSRSRQRTHSSPPPARSQQIGRILLAEIITAGRQALAKRHHPDIGGDAEKMKAINITADAGLEWAKRL